MYTETSGRICVQHKLRVKVKSLSEEAKLIRREVARARSPHVKDALNLHRVHVVRAEARLSQLALAAIRGVAYHRAEQKCKEPPDFAKVQQMLLRLHPWWSDDKQSTQACVDQWVNDARAYLDNQLEAA